MLYPGYLNLYETGELAERAATAWEILRSCTICPQNCRCNRIAGKTGVCRSGTEAIVASWNVHRREEPPISGSRGAGTIFFGYCQARCTYCQNFSLSQGGLGHRVGPERLADMMLYLQKKRCHNLDFVTPTHFVPQILAALVIACGKGLRLPIVYNCAGYENLETLKLLDGVVDIYLPDSKYSDNKHALRTSKMPHYVESNQSTLREMHRQVGPLVLEDEGIARRGLLIRHLAMPDHISGLAESLRWVPADPRPAPPLTLLHQSSPAWKAVNDPVLNRRLSWEEYRTAMDGLEELNLTAEYVQEDLMLLDTTFIV